MKKAVLLSLGVMAATSGAFAQQSIMLQQVDPGVIHAGGVAAQLALPQRGLEHIATNNAANKTNDGATGGWFSYVDAMYGGTGVGSGYFWQVTHDSSIKTDATTFNAMFGLGASFDPTSGAFSANAFNPADVPDFVVEADDAYRIDSFYTFISYKRRAFNGANTVDTVQVDIVKTMNPQTATSHVGKFQFPASAKGALFNAEDSIIRFADATYDPIRNQFSDSIPATQRFRYKMPLTAAFHADSNTAGQQDLQFHIPGGMMVDSNQKVAFFISFKPGSTYNFGRSIDSTNHMRLFSYLDQGQSSYVRQFGKDYTHFLWANRQTRYALPSAYLINGHRMLIPQGAYGLPTTPTGGSLRTGLTYSQMYITCTQCDTTGPLSVKTVSAVKDVAVVPNPANEQVEVRFSLGAAAQSVAVTLTNPMGQVVATETLGAVAAGARSVAKFNTSRLPAGVYFYSVEAAGGKTTGRVVVTH